MKVLMLCSSKSGGAATAAIRLGNALQLHSNKVTVDMLTRKDEDGEWIHSLQGFQKQKSEASFWAEALAFEPFRNKEHKRFSFSTAQFGVDISTNPLVQAADIIHIHWINQGFLSLGAIEKLAKLGKPILFSLHDMWSYTGGCHYTSTCTNYLQSCGNCFWLKSPKPNDISNKIWKKKQQIYTQYNNLHFIPLSQWMERCAKQSSLLKTQPLHQIGNPIDSSIFYPLEKPTLRQELGIGADKKLLLFVAMNANDTRKGFALLVDSIRQLEHKKDTYEILVIGKNSAEMSQSLALPTHPLGMISDTQKMVEIYNAADVFVIPSLEDNLPNTVVESLASGTPCVGFDAGGIPEMIDHQKNGYVAKFKDTTDLAKGIDWVLQHPDYTALQANARQKVMTTYDAPVIAKKYVDLYKKCLNIN